MKFSSTLFITFMCSTVALYGQGGLNISSVDSNFHLYILMGQSNMAGRGEITEEYKNEGHPNVVMLNKNNEWVPAHHPLHFDKSVAGVGPGLAFAIKMAEQNPKVKIGVVPCAVGGTSIRVWQPGAYDSSTKTHPYDDAVVRIKAAMSSGVVKGILWHQGESDSNPTAAEGYTAKLQKLVAQMRSLCNDDKLPVVVGELGGYKEQYQNINTQLKQLPAMVTNVAVASSEDLKDKGDNTHFDSASAEKLGERFAEKMIMLQKSQSHK